MNKHITSRLTRVAKATLGPTLLRSFGQLASRYV